MQTLPESLTHSGYTLTQIERTDTTAIYSKRKPGHHNDHFEAIRIRVTPANTFPNGKTYPQRESYPPSESWGTDGLTCPTLEYAREICRLWQNGATPERVREELPRLRHSRALMGLPLERYAI